MVNVVMSFPSKYGDNPFEIKVNEFLDNGD